MPTYDPLEMYDDIADWLEEDAQWLDEFGDKSSIVKMIVYRIRRHAEALREATTSRRLHGCHVEAQPRSKEVAYVESQ